MYRGFHPPIDPPTDDPMRAVIVLVLLGALALVPATMGKLFLAGNLGWPRTQARVIAFATWAVVMILVAWQLLV